MIKKNESGFTLIEMTIVLTIAISLTAIVIPIGLKVYAEKVERDAIDLFISTVYLTQSYAMANREYNQIRFITENEPTIYKVVGPGQKVILEKEFPRGLTIASSSPMKLVEFNPNGNMPQNGVLILVTKDKRIRITFQFQRGRMIIDESERVFLDGSNPNDFHYNNYFRHPFTNWKPNNCQFVS